MSVKFMTLFTSCVVAILVIGSGPVVGSLLSFGYLTTYYFTDIKLARFLVGMILLFTIALPAGLMAVFLYILIVVVSEALRLYGRRKPVSLYPGKLGRDGGPVVDGDFVEL